MRFVSVAARPVPTGGRSGANCAEKPGDLAQREHAVGGAVVGAGTSWRTACSRQPTMSSSWMNCRRGSKPRIAGTTRPSSSSGCPPRTRRGPRSSATSSRPSAPSREFAERDRAYGHASCASPTVSARTCALVAHAFSLLPPVPAILGFDPRLSVHPRGRHRRRLEHAVRHDLDGVYNCAADGVLALTSRQPLGKRPRRPAAGRHRPGRAAVEAHGHPPPARDAAAVALRPRARQPPAQGDRLPLPLTTRETVLRPADTSGSPDPPRRPAPDYRYEREVEEFLRYSPSVRPGADRGPSRPHNVRPGEAGGPPRSTILRRSELRPCCLARTLLPRRATRAREREPGSPEVMIAIERLRAHEDGP